jgi:acyl-CoA synthetase (AMP-forming)/AMP-acid ligase II
MEPVVHRPGATADETLRAVAEVHGDRDAYVEAGGDRLTFAGWDAAADGTAAALAELGVREGDVVALLLPSSADYAVCYQAAMRLGAITSGINPRLGPTEVASILRRSRPRVVVGPLDLSAPGSVPGGARPDTDRAWPSGDGWAPTVVDRAALRSWRTLDRPAHLPAPDPARPVAVVWTSGTTGDPKGAVFDHRNLAAVSVGAGPLRAPFDRRISPTPFSHVAYMTHLTEEIEYVITTIVPATPWKADAVLAQMAAERVTVGQGVPSQWRLLLDRPEFDDTDLGALRICGTGAAPAPPSLIREMKARLGVPVVIGYTSTEAALTTGSQPADSPDVIARTVGRARENVAIRVVDDDGQAVPDGDVGDVECCSDAVMRGYWEDPERTAAVLRPDGWLRTGDSGWLDDDGYLTLVGRRTEMYLRGGYNVYPVEVERVVSELTSVSQVAVVSRPDPVLGEIGVAFVVPAGPPPSRDEIRACVRRSIADYKAPDVVEIVAELPLTAVGKVDKRALGERAQAM